MKVHITRTPEVDDQLVKDVIEVLKLESGELEFYVLQPYDFEQLSTVVPEFDNPENIPPLQFNDFYKICNFQRKLKKIQLDEFIVVITCIPNEPEWFSAFEDKNIFVNATGWLELTNQDTRFGVAYQIVENIFQSLIKLDIPNYLIEPNIHHVPIGCINDMCDNEKEVLFKLRTGYICNSCFERALKHKVSDKVLLHIYRLIQNIRNEYMNYDDLLKILKPYYVKVHAKYIEVGDKRLKLGVLHETLFRFFLNHLEGVVSLYEEGKKYDEELLKIYSTLKKGKDYQRFKKTIDLLCEFNYDISTFSKVKSELNKKLREQIGVELYQYYIINETKTQTKEKILKINIPQMYIKHN